MPATVLVVDDSPEVRRLLADLLADAGYRVLVARDGTEALLLAHRTRPDVVLSDVLMPGLGGLALLARFERWSPPVPVILMSVAAVSVGGGVPFLRKPFDVRNVLAAVGAALPGAGGRGAVEARRRTARPAG